MFIGLVSHLQPTFYFEGATSFTTPNSFNVKMGITFGKITLITDANWAPSCAIIYNIRLYPDFSYTAIGQAPLFTLMKNEVKIQAYYSMSVSN